MSTHCIKWMLPVPDTSDNQLNCMLRPVSPNTCVLKHCWKCYNNRKRRTMYMCVLQVCMARMILRNEGWKDYTSDTHVRTTPRLHQQTVTRTDCKHWIAHTGPQRMPLLASPRPPSCAEFEIDTCLTPHKGY